MAYTADKQVTTMGSGTTASAGTTATTSQANEIVINVLATTLTSGTITGPGGAWSAPRANYIDASLQSISICDQVATSIGTFSGTWTITTAGWAAIIQTFELPSNVTGYGYLATLNTGVGHGASGGSDTLSAGAAVGDLVVVCSRVFVSQNITGIGGTSNVTANTWALVNGATENSPRVAFAYATITTALTASDTISVTTPGGNHDDAIVLYGVLPAVTPNSGFLELM